MAPAWPGVFRAREAAGIVGALTPGSVRARLWCESPRPASRERAANRDLERDGLFPQPGRYEPGCQKPSGGGTGNRMDVETC